MDIKDTESLRKIDMLTNTVVDLVNGYINRYGRHAVIWGCVIGKEVMEYGRPRTESRVIRYLIVHPSVIYNGSKNSKKRTRKVHNIILCYRNRSQKYDTIMERYLTV